MPTFNIKLKGKHVVLRVIHNRKYRDKRLGITCEPHQLVNGKLVGVHNVEEKNKKLEKALRIAESIETREFNYKKWSALYDEQMKQGDDRVEDRSLSDFARELSKKLMSVGSRASSTDYKHIANAIDTFSPTPVYFKEVTDTWLQDFEHFYVSRGCKTFSYMKLLRALFGHAIKRKIIKKVDSPFNEYSFSHLRKKKSKFASSGRVKDMPKDVVKVIIDYKPVSKKEEEYRDIWIAGYLLFGVNMIDIALMQHKDIKNGIWTYSRNKTGVTSEAGKPITELARQMIDKYHNPKNKYIFPILNGYDGSHEEIELRMKRYRKNVRQTCKRISKKLGIDGYFTYYSGRYSSATIALNEGADINSVKTLMDHKDIRTTNKYVGMANKQKLEDTIKLTQWQK